MSKTITIDDDVYDILKKEARNSGRTLKGEVRFIMSYCNIEKDVTPVDQSKPIDPFFRAKTPKEMEILELARKLEELEQNGELSEDNEEYIELMRQLNALQKDLDK